MATIRDGQYIYDTPYYYRSRPCAGGGVYGGYNFGFTGEAPTISIGSSEQFTAYWERQLFNEIASAVDLELPEHWDRGYTLAVLFGCGYLTVIDTPDFGIIPQYGTPNGCNVFYRPTEILIANPLIKKDIYTIGKDCAVIRIAPDWGGVWDTVHMYAENLAIITQSKRMAAINSRCAKAFGADDEATAKALKAMMMLQDDGSPVQVFKKKGTKTKDNPDGKPFSEFSNEVGKNYILDKLQDAEEAEVNAFLRQMGIPVLSDKKERLITSEVEATVATAATTLDVIRDTLDYTINQAAAVFPADQLPVLHRETMETEVEKENVLDE